jgi:hypothetical protein
MPKYAELIYNGFWFSPEREALQQLIDRTQEFVSGTVRLKLYKVGGGVEGWRGDEGGGAVRGGSLWALWWGAGCRQGNVHSGVFI